MFPLHILQFLEECEKQRRHLFRAQNRPGILDEEWEEIARQIAELDEIVEVTLQQQQ